MNNQPWGLNMSRVAARDCGSSIVPATSSKLWARAANLKVTRNLHIGTVRHRRNKDWRQTRNRVGNYDEAQKVVKEAL